MKENFQILPFRITETKDGRYGILISSNWWNSMIIMIIDNAVNKSIVYPHFIAPRFGKEKLIKIHISDVKRIWPRGAIPVVRR